MLFEFVSMPLFLKNCSKMAVWVGFDCKCFKKLKNEKGQCIIQRASPLVIWHALGRGPANLSNTRALAVLVVGLGCWWLWDMKTWCNELIIQRIANIGFRHKTRVWLVNTIEIHDFWWKHENFSRFLRSFWVGRFVILLHKYMVFTKIVFLSYIKRSGPQILLGTGILGLGMCARPAPAAIPVRNAIPHPSPTPILSEIGL